MRDMGTAIVEEHKALIARAETKIAEHAAGAEESGLRPPRIASRGSGEARAFPAALASRLTLSARRMRLLASLTEAEMKQASAKTCAEVVDAADRAAEREARSREAASDRPRARGPANHGARSSPPADPAGRASGA
jgi:hypothetical protein